MNKFTLMAVALSFTCVYVNAGQNLYERNRDVIKPRDKKNMQPSCSQPVYLNPRVSDCDQFDECDESCPPE